MKSRQSRRVGVGYPLRQNLLVGFVKITLVTLVVVGGPDPRTSPASYAPQHTDDGRRSTTGEFDVNVVTDGIFCCLLSLLSGPVSTV